MDELPKDVICDTHVATNESGTIQNTMSFGETADDKGETSIHQEKAIKIQSESLIES